MNIGLATPRAQLLAELMNSNNPKSEREHAAVREIERLTVCLNIANGNERFAQLVAEAEREACAKLCDEQTHGKSMWIEGAMACAAAIKSRT